ncbi:50S ribosomal protein L15 [Sulfurimonas sp.]|uniref:50S ribosomal protein L15 n=1 Tax=Sulfurimonas sp. TaxID=2022749 RepID=UPI0025F9BA56|nr:50S ribosomal protein L15 [Sulfurimonas sp.]MBT5935232.1 50S ribosomal protein L15 [Sulfurimonas sp.]
MGIENLTPSEGSTANRKRVGRGQGSGTGKTSARGQKGQKSRSGYKRKRNFEGGQQPLAKRMPKIGFTSRLVKPYVINVSKIKAVTELAEITMETLRSVHKIGAGVTKVKLVGATAKDLASKIKDENVTTTGN